MARATHVLKARKDNKEAGVKKGESYYWWKFKRGGIRYSKTPPKRSQLTQSAFYASVLDLEDDMIANATADDGLESARDDVVSQLEEIRDQCQESLDKMPGGLQQGSTGELLQERIDAMESAAEEFGALELDAPSDDDLDYPEREKGETEAHYEQRRLDARDGLEREYWEAKLKEFHGIAIEAP